MPGAAVLGEPHIERPGDSGNPERISGSTRLTATQPTHVSNSAASVSLQRGGLTLTLGEAADLSGNCHVDEERARG